MSEADIERVARASIVANANVPGNYIRRSELVCRMTGFRCEEDFALKYRLPYDAEKRAAKGGSEAVTTSRCCSTGSAAFDIKGRDGRWDDLLVQENKFKHGRLADYFVAARASIEKSNGWDGSTGSTSAPCRSIEPASAGARLLSRRAAADVGLDHLMMQHDDFARPA
jgi:hypothetical protein